MAQFVREFLTDHPEGWTRLQLRAVLRERPEFIEQFKRNPGAYYNMVERLLHRGDIVDRDGRLHPSQRTSRRILTLRASGLV